MLRQLQVPICFFLEVVIINAMKTIAVKGVFAKGKVLFTKSILWLAKKVPRVLGAIATGVLTSRLVGTIKKTDLKRK
jgi:hypothetical protein